MGEQELALLTDLVASYLFEKSKTLLKRTTYCGIYQDDGLVVFKGKKIVQEIKDWLVEFQQTVDKAGGNQHLQFTAELWGNYVNLPPSENKYKVQIVENNDFPFLDMRIRCFPEGCLKSGLFRNKGHQLK